MSTLNQETLTRLFNEQAAALVLYARQWSSTPEDIVQEGFLHLARQSTTPDNPVGWLYRVVRNAAISASRSAGRRQRRETAVAHQGEPWFLAPEDSRLDAVAASRAIEGLPPEEREVVITRIWGGLSFEEIAALAGASISTVYRRYQAGLATLRERLSQTCPKKNP